MSQIPVLTRRFGALLLDMAIVYASVEVGNFLMGIDGTVMSLLVPFFFIAIAVSFPLFESSRFQGTPGKILMKVRVVTSAGQRLSFWRAAMRTLLKALGIAFIIGVLPVFFTRRQQAAHDILASTLVTGQEED